jgi:hypothetical protein
MATHLYVKGDTQSYGVRKQVESAIALAERLGLGNVNIHAETFADDDRVALQMVRQVKLGDTVVVPTLDTLGATPSTLSGVVSQITANGGEVIAQDAGDRPLDVLTFKRIANAFAPLETKLQKVTKTLDDERALHREEIERHGNAVKEQMIKVLMGAGIDIVALMTPKDSNIRVPDDAPRARDLKAKRMALGLTQIAAGKLVEMLGEPAVSGSEVSKIENTGNGPHIDVYEIALAIGAKRKTAGQAVPSDDAPSSAPSTTEEPAHAE